MDSTCVCVWLSRMFVQGMFFLDYRLEDLRTVLSFHTGPLVEHDIHLLKEYPGAR
jgi:hypothetical protein